MDIFLHHLRNALRHLVKSPGFTVTAVLSLALGIGANTAIFSLVNAILVRDLPLERPEELVEVYMEQVDFPTSLGLGAKQTEGPNRGRAGSVPTTEPVMPPRFPQLAVKLRTRHPLALVAAVRQVLRKSGLDRREIRRFSELAMRSSDPEEQRRVCADWVRVG